MRQYLVFISFLYFTFSEAQTYVTDPQFGENGYVVTNYNMYYDNNQAPKNVCFVNNKYVFAQKTQLSCFLENGLVDYTFATMGLARIIPPECPTCEVLIKDLKIINDNIFVYGKFVNGPQNLLYGFIAKLNANGVFDETFGNDGIALVNIEVISTNYENDGITDLVYKDGSYFAVGTVFYDQSQFTRNVFMVKLNQNGVVDLTLNPTGLKKFTSINGHGAENILVFEDDLLILGNIQPNNVTTEHSATFMKVDENGNMVSTYGDNGLKKIVLVDGVCSCGEAFSSSVLIDNTLYYVHSRGEPDGGYTKLQKLDILTLENLNTVTSVDITDIAYLKTNTRFSVEEGKIYILNCPLNNAFETCPLNFTITRRLANGMLDTSFNQSGFFSFEFPPPFVGGPPSSSNSSTFVKNGNEIMIGGYTSAVLSPTAPHTGFAMVKITSEALTDGDFNLTERLSIYPNPTKDIININNPENLTIENVIITDQVGKIVYFGNKQHIDITTLSEGMYFMRIRSGNKTGCFKIIKE